MLAFSLMQSGCYRCIALRPSVVSGPVAYMRSDRLFSSQYF